MIDSILSLVMSMHANPGVYTLLLGPGMSRSAEILDMLAVSFSNNSLLICALREEF